MLTKEYNLKFTDILVEICQKWKINTVFGLQGGAVVHIFDSFEKYKLNVIYTHHEQTAALAAASFARTSNSIGCVVTTTGPGSTNAITGLMGAFQDSIPVLFISGQVRSSHVSYKKSVRQFGTQEAPIIDIIKPLVKATLYIDSPKKILELNNLLKIATEGRPGPVWLDVPLNFQWEEINTNLKIINNYKKIKDRKFDLNKFKKSFNLLLKSKKPLFVIGYGVRLSKTEEILSKIIENHNFQYVTTWTAADIFETVSEKNLGIIGMSGQKGANKAIFKSDLLVCLGTHLSIPHTTTLYESYAKNAKKIIINIDLNQLKNLNVKFDLKIHADLKDYLKYLDFFLKSKNINKHWEDRKNLKKLNWYEIKSGTKPNINNFIRNISKKISSNTCYIIDGGGTALYAGFQSVFLKKGQRLICSSTMSSMGTGLAETLGAYQAKKYKKLVCIIGDGSFIMNIQDLQSIVQFKIPVVIILVNNNGYLAIRHTQAGFLKSKYYGTHPNWGLNFPNFEKVTKSFGLNYIKLSKNKSQTTVIKELLNVKKPTICEVVVDENSPVLFKQKYQDNKNGTFTPMTLEDMWP